MSGSEDDFDDPSFAFLVESLDVSTQDLRKGPAISKITESDIITTQPDVKNESESSATDMSRNNSNTSIDTVVTVATSVSSSSAVDRPKLASKSRLVTASGTPAHTSDLVKARKPLQPLINSDHAAKVSAVRLAHIQKALAPEPATTIAALSIEALAAHAPAQSKSSGTKRLVSDLSVQEVVTSGPGTVRSDGQTKRARVESKSKDQPILIISNPPEPTSNSFKKLGTKRRQDASSDEDQPAAAPKKRAKTQHEDLEDETSPASSSHKSAAAKEGPKTIRTSKATGTRGKGKGVKVDPKASIIAGMLKMAAKGQHPSAGIKLPQAYDEARPMYESNLKDEDSQDEQADKELLHHILRDEANSRVVNIASSTKHLLSLGPAPLGVQWFAARHAVALEAISQDVIRKLTLSDKSNVEGVVALRKIINMSGDIFQPELEALRELDLETAMIKQCRTAALGCKTMTAKSGDAPVALPGWYGGKVQFRLAISYDKTATSKDTKLITDFLPLKLGTSHQISRYGSSNHIDVSISKKAFQQMSRDDWTQWCKRTFSIYVVLFGSLMLSQLKKCMYRIARRDPALCHHNLVPNAMPIRRLLNHLNPILLNKDQKVSKWRARIQIFLSVTVPVLEFAPENILFLEDIYAGNNNASTAEAHQTMTDGCSLINLAAVNAFVMLMKWKNGGDWKRNPIAFQGRIAGAKGVWAINEMDQSKEPKIWIRRSQRKVVFGNLVYDGADDLKRDRVIFNLVRPARSRSSVNISGQAVTVLVANQVPVDAIKVLQTAMFEKINEPYQLMDAEEDLGRLARTVNVDCGVNALLIARDEAAASRAKSGGRLLEDFELEDFRDEDAYVARAEENGDTDSEDDEANEDTERSATEILVPADSSSPSSQKVACVTIGEKVYRMLLAGISPKTYKPLRDDLWVIRKRLMERACVKGQVNVPHSIEAMIIPDPLGVLEEGQCHFISSSGFLNTDDQIAFELVGSALILRNPLRLSTDIRRTEFIKHDKLKGYVDVVVVSIKGVRSLASMLSGGDYDGDTVTVLYSRLLTGYFKNSTKLDVMDLSKDLDDELFESATHNLAEVVTRGDSFSELLDVLHSGCNDKDRVGILSGFHDIAAYVYGLDDPRSVKIAHAFNGELDGSKSGKRVREVVFAAWQQEFERKVTKPGQRVAEFKKKTIDNPIVLRAHDEKKDIHLALWNNGRTYREDRQKAYEVNEANMPKQSADLGLGAVWIDFTARVIKSGDLKLAAAKEMAEILNAILARCLDLHRRWKAVQSLRAKLADDRKKGHVSKNVFAQRKKDYDQEARSIQREFEAEFLDNPIYSAAQIHDYMLSCAYWIDAVKLNDKGWPADTTAKFAFAIAFESQCDRHAKLKAHATIRQAFLNHMRPSYS
ncbi:RNA dependent RNA polymerase-domain-containing protein [Auriculariales sp. MPI-PUGE-AT-0066]|nr:RNA dependent RNA polymerase-domain-containing protein [Auriculariales sp. MPI-PUGE-AT-0066]